MFNLGLFELTLFGIIALVILGPEKLLITARTLGRWYRMARQTTTRLQNEFSSQLDLIETQTQLKKEIASFKESEQKMQSQLLRLEQALGQKLDLFNQDFHDVGKDEQPSVWQQIADWGDPKPMHQHFFVLGEYDRARRLPKPPFLPNYTADPLLYQSSL